MFEYVHIDMIFKHISDRFLEQYLSSKWGMFLNVNFIYF